MNDMRIGNPEIEIQVGADLLLLRPSLRCACRLERRYNGFEPLFRAIADGHLGTITDIIIEGAADLNGMSRQMIEAVLGTPPIGRNLDAIKPALLAFLLEILGVDPDAEAMSGKGQDSQQDGEPLKFRDYYQKLFRIGTGWIGWTPAQTWEATPFEILEAYKGRTELLQAIFGGGSDNEDSPAPAPKAKSIESSMSETLDLDGLNALKGLGGL